MAEMKVTLGMDTSEFETGLARVQNQVSRIKGGSIFGGFRSLAADLASANSPAEALATTFGRLGDVLKGTIFGGAGLAIGKLLAAPFEKVSEIVKEGTEVFTNAMKQMQDAGDALNFEQAVGQVSNLTAAVNQIDESIKKLDANFFTRLVAGITGSKDVLQGQKNSLLQNAGGKLATGLMNETERAKFTAGMSGDERQLFEISERERARQAKIRATFKDNWSPVADQAMNESFNLFLQERNAKLTEIAKKAADKETQERIKTDQELLRIQQEERDMQIRSEERRRDSRRESMLEEFNRGLDEARGMVSEAERRGVPVSVIQQERAIKAFDQQARAGGPTDPMQILADGLQQVGGGGRFAQVGGGESRELVGTAKEQLKALQQIIKNTEGESAGPGVQ